MNKVIFYIALALSFGVVVSLALPGDKDPKQVASAYNDMEYSSAVGGTSKLEFDKFRSNYLENKYGGGKGEAGSAELPTGTDVSEWVAYTEASVLSDQRKKSVLESLDTVSKGCIYHGLRPGTGKPSSCAMGGCDGQNNGQPYDFATQADFKLEDPVYLDCSYFVKHCWYIGGVQTQNANTGGYLNELVKIEFEELIPGDAVLKNGHVRMFIGMSPDGKYVCTELMSHSNDAVVAFYTKDEMVAGGYTARRVPMLVSDTTYEPPNN